MINRISEIPTWGPEEQIRRFINQHDDDTGDKTQQDITQQRIENLNKIFQKQLLWSYNRPNVDDAYFYQDWCPVGTGTYEDPKWQIVHWNESRENLQRDIDRTFNWKEFNGYQNTRTRDEMVLDYDSRDDAHTRETPDDYDMTNLDVDTLRHNIMRSYLEVSEWLGVGAEQYGSHNGYVSRKMSLAWLFNAVKALISWKVQNQNKWAEADIHPLVVDGREDASGHQIRERFLDRNESSTQGYNYNDIADLDQTSGNCSYKQRCRAERPWEDGVLNVRGNEWHYGERAYFWTHTSFIGECRFFHNARFLG